MKLYLQTDFPAPLKSHTEEHETAMRLLSRALHNLYHLEEPYTLAAEEGGKPCIEGHPEIRFNISHCHSAAAVVISEDGQSVGVDVQHPFPWKEKLAQRICSPRELKYLGDAADEAQRAKRLQQIWCRKEALLKCIGIGITVDLRTVDTTERGGQLHYNGMDFSFIEYVDEAFCLCGCQAPLRNS